MGIQITSPEPERQYPVFLELGFRPFFLCAAVFSIVSMGLWSVSYFLGWHPGPAGISPGVWHAHEMIYGYAMAVIAGFLLTAVRNWTGIQTLHGYGLAGFAALWVLARMLWMVDAGAPLWFLAVMDNLFILLLTLFLAIPVVRSRNWRQISVLSKIVLLFLSNILFYLGFLGILPQGVTWGLYSGFYLVIGLIMMMGRRVIPFFITRGVGYAVEVKNWRWVDLASAISFIAFWFFSSFTAMPALSSGLAIFLFFVLGIRLWGWHTPGIWKKPLLWILYLAYGFIVLGFLLFAMAHNLGVSPYLAVHAFAAGGIGMMTLGMMARVALGHTGRNIQVLPGLLPVVLSLSAMSAVVRVILPMFVPHYDSIWIGASQLLWVAAFTIFTWIYFPILVAPRIQGR